MKVFLSGYGKMGRMLEELALEHGWEVVGHADITCPEAYETAPGADVCLDFSGVGALQPLLGYLHRTKTALVSGTTGLTEPDLDALQELGRELPVIWTANYSTGIAVFRRMLHDYAGVLAGWDKEIVEIHHTQKADAPSGTAKLLLQELDPEGTATGLHGREGLCGKRKPEEAARSLAYVAEGASIPATAIRTREHLVRLYKRGRMLVASYEALRLQKLDLFSVMLRQIGAQIQAMHLEDAVNVLLNGDGNDNAAAVCTAGTSPISGEQGTLTYAQLVEFWAQFAPYEMNTMLVSNATMVRLLKLTELQNPLTGLNFQGTGKFETPLGASLLRTQAMADGCILAFDRRYALEMVQAGDVSVEYDKLIDRQLERAAITSISGFGKSMPEASKVLVIG